MKIIYFNILLCVLVGAVRMQSPPLPRKVFHFIRTSTMTWEEADKHCQSRGWNLASIKSKEESDKIKNEISSGDGGNYWIGATRAANGRDWIWYPSNDPLTFTNWEYGQPDSHTDADGTEDCVHLWNTQEYKWNDSKCHYYFYSVCEEYCLF